LIEQKGLTTSNSRVDEVEDELYRTKKEIGRVQESLKARAREIENLNSKI
jgi:archaellum component FlaC